MDRNKQSIKRGPKVKTLPPPGDFIVLGSKASTKSTSAEAADVKLGSGSHKGHTGSGSNGDRKRDGSGSSSPSAPLSKKPKLGSTSGGSRDDGKKEREAPRAEMWDAIAIDVDPANLVNLVLAAENGSDDEKIERMLCGAVKLLRSNRMKPESSLYLGLMLLAKTRPVLFCTDHVTEAFSSLLKRDSSINFKSKGNCLVPVLASNILLAAYQDDKNWPDVFVKLYLDDAFGDRIWVDHFYCKGFVDNILSAFNTKLPSKKFSPPELNFKPDAAPSPPAMDVDDDTTESMNSNEGKEAMDIPVYARYSRSQESTDQYVMEMTRDHVARRQPMDNVSWNVLKVLGSTCGLSEVRSLVAQRLEMWLQNPKLTKPAQDLLLNVCMNCSLHNQQDIEVISHLIKIRLKTKPIINHYLQCIRELLNQHPDNLSTVLKHIIYNELSTSRNPNNMALLGVIFPHAPEQAAKTLAEVFQDVLNNRDDYLRAVRVLFREIVRSLRHDINFPAFCLGLMQERKEALFKDMEQSIRDRMFLAIADLITLSIFLSITPLVREAASANARGDKRDIVALRNFQNQVTEIQRDAVWWLHTLVPKAFKPAKTEFVHCLQKILFMEQLENYCNKDNWPQESERIMFLRLASEVPVLEDTLIRVLVIGLSKEHPLPASDALDLVDLLVKRVASLCIEDLQGIKVQRIELFNAVFDLCVYHYPETITLPSGYKPPDLAIASLYWKAWIMLLIITAHNPSTFGITAWENFPTLRCFMEMCITNQFSFPPPTMGEKADEMKVKELQICQLEKQEILEFENHLASASMAVVISESNSLLLSQLTMLDPRGFSRRPSSQTLDQLKALNQSLKLGHLLCRSRNPDFLLDIIQRQGASQSMPWLADLVESSEGAFDMLPVQCLCEFLLNEEPAHSKLTSDDSKEETKAEKAERVKRKEKARKQQQLLRHLRDLLYGNVADPQSTLEVLDYFLRRLSSQQSNARQQAARGLSLVLVPPVKVEEDDDDDVIIPDDAELGRGHTWLLKHMPQLPHFDSVRYQTSLALRQACLVEYDSTAISSYVQFLSEHAPMDLLQDLADLALDIAQMIIERTTIINYLLPSGSDGTSESNVMQAFMSIFMKYLRKAREPSKEAYSWSEAQDHILIQWGSGEAATMHIFVVQAMVVLLTYGPPVVGETSMFSELLEIWFPSTGSSPQAFLVDTSEEALLFPDWLKLRMMRSSVEVLVDAALKDLDPAQLVLFIQSFGLPIQSLSKLLRALDLAVEYNSYHVEQAVVDKDYMSKLIEVQKQRGARYGERFSTFLGIRDEGSDDEKDVLLMDIGITPVRHRASPIVVNPPPTPLPTFSEKETGTKLSLLFGPDVRGNLTRSECLNVLRSLQKHIAREASVTTMEKPFTREIIAFLSNVFDPMEGSNLIQQLNKKHTISCPLFRLLLSSCCKSGIISNPFASKLKDVCMQIVACSMGSKSPLIKVICENKQLSLKVTVQSEIDQSILSSLDHLDSQTAVDQDSIIKVIQDTILKCPSHIEQVVQTLVHKAMKKNQSKSIIAALTRLLVDNVPCRIHSNIATNSLLVDWLELVEPEVINAVPELQQWLLFRRRQDGDTKDQMGHPIYEPSIYKTCRPYLLATLTHQANWETLQNCINFLLCSKDGEDTMLTRYTPAVVLDFLWACIYIPKIWQGRDKHVPKHYIEENVLGLTVPQVIQVAHYILAEASNFLKSKDIEEDAGRLGENKAARFNPMETRLPLLLHCCNYQPDALKSLVHHLLDMIENEHPQEKLAHELLLHAYLQIPRIINYIDNVDVFFENTESTLKTPSKLDSISHTLLTALANTDTVRDWKDKKQDVDLACRKLASTHPILMLRQLPMLATALRGRVHFEFVVFRARHHLAFFTCIMGLLELLQPHLYKVEYGVALEDVCESYFNLIKAHGFQNKELIGLITRFLNILLEFMAYDARRAVRYIQKHAHILRDLSLMYPDHSSLCSITSVISLPRHVSPFEIPSSEEPAPLILSFALPQQPPAWTPAVLAPIVARLANLDSVEDVMIALHELDMISNRKVTCLEHFTEELKKLLVHPSESCRNLAHNLLMRLLKQKPSLSKDFLGAFLACLESGNYDVVISALERLAEFVLLCQEHASLLLQRVFHLNMTTNINTVPYVGEIIMLLNMLSGS